MVPIGVITAGGKQSAAVAAHFKAAGAVEPGRAISWAPDGKMQAYEFKGLVEKGALVEMRPGHYYLNLEKLSSAGSVQAVLLVLALALAALLAGTLLLMGRS